MSGCDGNGGARWWVAATLGSCVEQHFCSRSAANLTSPTVLLLRTSIILFHVGGEGQVFSHVLRVSLRRCERSSYCSFMASSVPTLMRSCKPISYHFARTLFNSSITTRKSSTPSCWPDNERSYQCYGKLYIICTLTQKLTNRPWIALYVTT